MGHLGFHLAAALTLLRRDEVGEMFPETDGADSQRVGQQEPAALLFLHEDNELVMEVAVTSHEAPPYSHSHVHLLVDGLGDQAILQPLHIHVLIIRLIRWDEVGWVQAQVFR
jgi:hypothetical protein